MAVAGLHKASGLDSYLGNKERSTTQTSSIRKMWRDLENEGKVMKNERRQTSGIILGPESPCSASLEGESMESEDALRVSSANEIENVCPQSQNQMVLQEKEGVRKNFHDWGSKSFGEHTLYTSSRAQRVGENECKRVRVVREWIESSTQQGDICRTTGSEESITKIVSRTDGAQKSIRRIYGRQALLDLLTKFVRERQREVDDLMENRSVSNFAHRHRIQSILKARFLKNQRFVEDEKQTSVAASELGFLRQTHAVSDIRKGFLTRLNNYSHAAQSDSDTSSDNEMNNYDRIEQAEEIAQEIQQEIIENFDTTNLTSHPSPVEAMHDNNILQDEEREKLSLTVDYSPQGTQSDSDTSPDNDMTHEHTEQDKELVGEEVETNNFTSNAESTSTQSDSETSSDDDMKFDHTDQIEEIFPETPHIPQESHDDETVRSDVQESHEEEWFGNDIVGGYNSYMEAALVSRSNTFYWSDDDDGDTRNRAFELGELRNRRRVSNLLQSDFGARLDQLMQSLVNRQDDSFGSESEWMQDYDQPNGLDPSPQTHDYHLVAELEIINGLRIDMEILEQRMNDMQKTLEACMYMQTELQRSVQQEVYSALNRSSNTRGAVEDCFLCCDDGLEPSPDRSAKMLHICSNCAQKVNWSKIKESVRQP